jgi:two-component system sensor kinase FixL
MVNRGGRENLGYTLAEMRQLTPVDLKPDFTDQEFRNMIQPLLAGQVDKLEFGTRHCRKDGTFYDVDVHLQVSNYRSRPVFVAIILDVTERRSAELLFREQQQNMNAELERLVESRTEDLRKAQADLVLSEKFSTLGKVAGGIAHEIRNPLNAVKTSAYYLLNAKNATPEKVREHLERIDRQVSMVDGVVTALADVAKLPDADLKPLILEPLLREVVASTNLPTSIQVEYEFPAELPQVLADEHQIAIAFRNLVRNARDAMPAGGTLIIGAEVESDSVVFSVTDSGVGISEQLIDNILEPLFTTKARGMGLGLSITLAIVEKNQGRLSFSSKLGEGAKFSIALKRGM